MSRPVPSIRGGPGHHRGTVGAALDPSHVGVSNLAWMPWVRGESACRPGLDPESARPAVGNELAGPAASGWLFGPAAVLPFAANAGVLGIAVLLLLTLPSVFQPPPRKPSPAPASPPASVRKHVEEGFHWLW